MDWELAGKKKMACHRWLQPIPTPTNPGQRSWWVAQWTKELKRMMSRFDFRLKCRVKSTFQSVDAKYELCACELDQNVEMYCNCVWWGGGPSIHAVAITWVEKAAASIIKKLLLVPTFGGCLHPYSGKQVWPLKPLGPIHHHIAWRSPICSRF